ncbi:hypothetical protein SAY87_003771 [Trapa incisa]|uniref:EF-hand domain-containing protein n=1 Tax=Trapa incisa TaxID=236973 RepID=A0AAN7KL88_9MYRT|nr:hypothetical protein SAY87_003771 [Trapa incisa]
MAIKNRSFPSDGCTVMSLEQFKQWLKMYDSDRDGRISKAELSRAIRTAGGWFSRHKCNEAVGSADVNRNGFIDEDEIEELVEFARKRLRVRVVAF